MKKNKYIEYLEKRNEELMDTLYNLTKPCGCFGDFSEYLKEAKKIYDKYKSHDEWM